MNDKEKAEVMLAAHRGKQIEYKQNLTSKWTHCCNPCWCWDRGDYRIASEKPEPLELWVNIYKDREKHHSHSSERLAILGGQDGGGKTSPKIKCSAVHMREVVPVELLEVGVWHEIHHYLRIIKKADGVIEITDRVNPQQTKVKITLGGRHRRALISALQGLMEGES